MRELDPATKRAKRRRSKKPAAVAARYDRARDRVIVELSTGYEVAFPPRRAQGLDRAKPADLELIEISPSGFGLHFPKLDADLWLPALLEGVFGSRRWMAARLGARGGRVKSKAKTLAARANGKRGRQAAQSRAATLFGALNIATNKRGQASPGGCCTAPAGPTVSNRFSASISASPVAADDVRGPSSGRSRHA